MASSKRRFGFLLLGLPVVVVVVALLYMLAMGLFESEPRGFWDALEWAAETLSTTGYGADAEWTHPLMVIFVVVVQFLGVFLIFLIFPIYLIPFLEERFGSRIPKSVDLREHLLIYQYGAPVTTLLDEMRRSDVATVVIEDDVDLARRVLERGHQVVLGNLDSGALDRCSLLEARGTGCQRH